MPLLNVSPAVARHIEIELPVSCYVFGTFSPTLENGMHNKEVLIIELSSHSRNQRTIASIRFYCHENGKHNTVVSDNGDAASFQNDAAS